ncbi:hypothetical protein Taro_018449, partial [Colocasia esculenta]|nr:hypothetical protein [Colocasia esculenta]
PNAANMLETMKMKTADRERERRRGSGGTWCCDEWSPGTAIGGEGTRMQRWKKAGRGGGDSGWDRKRWGARRRGFVAYWCFQSWKFLYFSRPRRRLNRCNDHLRRARRFFYADASEQLPSLFVPRDRGGGLRESGVQWMAAWRDASATWGMGKKPPGRLGGMAEALSIASDLGFAIPSHQEDGQNRPSSLAKDKNDDFIKILSELASTQRDIATLQVELQGRKDEKNVGHLTHVSGMEKKIESLTRMTAILKGVIQNKDWIIARLQQPCSLDFIPIEPEFQKQFSELLLDAASDYGILTASVADLQWIENLKESPSRWGEMLRPIPAALASCSRFFEAMSAMRESLATLQQLRIGQTSLSTLSDSSSMRDSKFMTPPQWRGEMSSGNSNF